jgi:ECF transporter S component (folate family)
MQKSKKMIRLLTNMAMMIALSVVIGIFCKTVLNFGNGLFRITFENLPIILTGIALGPVAGGVVGLSSDIISYLLSPQTYPLNIVVTIGAAVIGILSGLISKYIIKRKCKMQIIVSSTVAHLVGSMIIKSIGLYSYYGVLVLWRIPLYIAIATVEIILLCLLLQSKAFSKTVGYIEELK